MNIKHVRPGKESVDVPDFFEVKISYHSGRKQTIKAVTRTLVNCQFIPTPQGGQTILPLNGNSYWEFLTSENLYVQVPIASTESIEYDASFTKIVEAAQNHRKKLTEEVEEAKQEIAPTLELVE